MKKARIYKPSKNAMQSGRAKTEQWVVEYDSPSARAPEALMGWTQAGDTLSQIKLKFDTLEAATDYAEKNGIDYFVSPVNERKIKPRNYGDNFKYVPVGEPKPVQTAAKPKKTASKSTAKKAAPAKKTAAKTTAKKAAPAKKTAAKTTAKKAPAKKPAAKSAAAKKAPAKKTASKAKK